MNLEFKAVFRANKNAIPSGFEYDCLLFYNSSIPSGLDCA